MSCTPAVPVRRQRRAQAMTLPEQRRSQDRKNPVMARQRQFVHDAAAVRIDIDRDALCGQPF